MFYLILSLIALGCIAAAAGYFRKTGISEAREFPGASCCGRHEICERDSLRAGVSGKIAYYDDEELDRFSGTNSDAYDNESVDEFRDVLNLKAFTDMYCKALELKTEMFENSIRH